MAGDEIVARTESPAAASVGEDHHSERPRRKAENSFKGEAPPCELYRRFIHCRSPGCILHFLHLPITDQGPSGGRHSLIGRSSTRCASRQSCRGSQGNTVSFLACVLM